MQPGKKKKIVGAFVTAMLAAGAGIGSQAYNAYASDKSQAVYKETQVEKGNLTTGVTESGSASIGSVTQDFDLEDSTDTASSSSASTGDTSASGGASANQMAGTAQSTTTSASASLPSLEVEEVYVTVGQKVTQGEAILKITQESLEEYENELEESVSSAQLELKQAQLSAETQKMEADYTYNTSVANGSVAQSEYNSTIASLQAAVDAAQASLSESAEKISEYQNKIAAGEDYSANLVQEQANYNSLQAKLQSALNSQAIKSVEAKQVYDEAVLNSQNAKGLYSINTAGLSDSVEDAQEALEDAQEMLSEFQTVAGDGTIYAEYTGILSAVGYEAGDTLSESISIATFEDSSAVKITVSVSQEDITAVQIGDKVNIELTAYEDEVFEGTVESMNTSVSSGTSTVSYNVTVLFTGDTEKIYQDMTGNVTFISNEVKDVLYVSNKAIQNDGTISYTEVKNEDGTIQKTEVETGFSDGVNVEIQSGLKEGQTVLIKGQVAKNEKE